MEQEHRLFYNFQTHRSPHLTTLQLSDTQICGILPKRVFHLSNLESLDLSENPQLTVRFPTTKWNSSASLMELHLSHVNFTGRIPESFSHLTSLHKLYLDNNHLEGPNSQFLRFEKLRYLSLRNNNFDGRLECLSFNRSWTQFVMLDFRSNSIQRKWTAKPKMAHLVIKPLEWDYTFLDILPSFTDNVKLEQ
ncbi:hypothetical protein AABB24_021125 [Solanum stoloniferum]|uniref:Uncharacterized protein n=1 Tax=Solanum stoloniferum TaxID=62892 RepID=A0ABD2STM9_9SOLN